MSLWRWEYDERKRSDDRSGSAIHQWERGASSPARRWLVAGWKRSRTPLKITLIAGFAFTAGIAAVTGPDAASASTQLRSKLGLIEGMLTARHGELELARIELARLQEIMDYSARYRIPADLATQIHDAARAEGVEVDLAFSLVRVESEFLPTAVSPVGAVGLTQLMPSTAFEMAPDLGYRDLFDRETNLRLGFRYLRGLLRQYDGDLRLALLAYNRGPGRVDRIIQGGGDPGNGYARNVLGGR